MAPGPPPSDETMSVSHFSTSGQVSWTGLISTTFNATADVLTRLSMAGVDVYTLAVSQKLGSSFQLTPTGRRRITEALSQLHSYGAVGTALYFGLGINHIVRVLGKTEEGQMCLMLCAALTECYETSVAAEILIEMVKLSRTSPDALPSIFQWESLLNTCAGLFSASLFPEIAEMFMALHPTRRQMCYEPLIGDLSKHRGCSTAASIAQALVAVAQVSRGDLESITIAGGPDAGFIAAVAEWFLEVPVSITDGASHMLLHQSTTLDGIPKVNIIFEDRSKALRSLQTKDRTFKLENATSAIREESRYNINSISGRVSWGTALSSTFNVEFTALMKNSRAVAIAIGSFAKVLEAIALDQDGMRDRYACILGYWPGYPEPESRGRAFASLVTNKFEEISKLNPEIALAAKKDARTAVSQYGIQVQMLHSVCGCAVCCGIFAADGTFCQVLILEVVICVTFMLSTLDLPVPLSPSRNGLELVYAELLIFRRELEEYPNKLEMSRIVGPLYFPLQRHHQRDFVMLSTLQLFTGRIPVERESEVDACAISFDGICIYPTALSRTSGGVITHRLTVVQGHIELHGKTYRTMVESNPSKGYDIGGKKFLQAALKVPIALTFSELDVFIRETISSLQLELRIRDPISGEFIGIITPCLSLNSLRWVSGWIGCEGRRCPDLSPQPEIEHEETGYTKYRVVDRFIHYIAPTNPSAALPWAVGMCDGNPVVKARANEECLHCCLRKVLALLEADERYSPDTEGFILRLCSN